MKGDEHPAYAPLEYGPQAHLPLPFPVTVDEVFILVAGITPLNSLGGSTLQCAAGRVLLSFAQVVVVLVEI